MTNNEQGCLAETLFVAECLKLGIVPCKPILDVNGYDIVIPKGDSFVKVQVKSTAKKSQGRSSYKLSTHRGCTSRNYNERCTDYFAFYIFPLDRFYIVPRGRVDTAAVYISCDPVKDKYKEFINAWHLLK